MSAKLWKGTNQCRKRCLLAGAQLIPTNGSSPLPTPDSATKIDSCMVRVIFRIYYKFFLHQQFGIGHVSVCTFYMSSPAQPFWWSRPRLIIVVQDHMVMLIIWKNFVMSNYVPESYFKYMLLQEHVAVCSGSWVFFVCLFVFFKYDPGTHLTPNGAYGQRSWSQIS